MKKVILITGTSSGFGALMVKSFAQEGHTVIATMRGTTGKNIEAANALAVLPNVEVLELDVTKESSVQSAVAAVVAKHQRIDVLINNAGLYGGGLLEGYSIAQFQKLMDVNVYGILRLYAEVLPVMRAQKAGLVINISSSIGRYAFSYSVPYSATKFVVEAITEGGYTELLGHGIETVVIEPGAYPTELFGKAGVDADRADVVLAYGDESAKQHQVFGETLYKTMMGKSPNPQEIADAALRLVNMEKGTRPLRTPVDMISGGIAQEYDTTTSEIVSRWKRSYGF
jgi:NADP-dependent 3-hydroxy acid dehydrogenase YdfG